MNKKLLATILTLGVITSVGYFGTNYVLADYDNPMHDSIVSKIAEKFNLNEADVEAVFESVRDERQDEMKKEREENLSNAVSDGVITESQKQDLLSKMEDHSGERQTNRSEIQKWFEDNNVDETKLREYLRPEGRGMREGRGMGVGR